MYKSTLVAGGIDTYYIPDDWMKVTAVYIVPILKANEIRLRAPSDQPEVLRPYKVQFVVEHPDRDDVIDKIHRKIRLRTRITEQAVLVADMELVPKN